MPTKRERLSESQIAKFHRETSHVFDKPLPRKVLSKIRKRNPDLEIDERGRVTSKQTDDGKDKYFEVKFRTDDPSPPEMEEFYENLSNAINKKWFYQEFGVRGKDKGHRKIGFMNLTPLQYSTVKHTARRFLPKPTFKKT